MLNQKTVERLEKSIPMDCNGEDRRAAYCVITGLRDGKTAREIARYYTVDTDLVDKWIKFFDVESTSSEIGAKKRGRKGSDLTNYVKSNIGKTVTPKDVAEELGISLPTFYNFYNANRGFFKKVKRGEFQIINPEHARNSGE